MMLLRILACCVLCCFAFLRPSHAQFIDAPDRTLSIKFSPQHLFIHGYHLYFEKILAENGRHGVVFSPRLYSGETRTVGMLAGRSWDERQHNHVFGFGMELQHRIYTSELTDYMNRKVYFAYGVNYHHFNVEFKGNGWVKATNPEGLEVYKYRNRSFNEKTNSLGGLAILGWQAPSPYSPVIVDFYGGIGYKHSFIKTDYSRVRFNQNAFDFGYTGFYFAGGITLGVALK